MHNHAEHGNKGLRTDGVHREVSNFRSRSQCGRAVGRGRFPVGTRWGKLVVETMIERGPGQGGPGSIGPRKGTVAVTPREVLASIRQREVTTVDLRFMDFPGVWQHFAIPADLLTEETFEEGLAFDGSSVVGWRAINEADLLVVPQPETALIDPFMSRPTLMMICNIQDPITQEDYTRDPRNIARKAVSHMKSTGIVDACLLGPELEFFVFDDVRFDQRAHEAFYHVDSVEGAWNRGTNERPNLGYKPGTGLGYFPCPPTDSLADLRTEMAQIMAECGIRTTAHHHEVATGGQCEIDLENQGPVKAADQVMLARYIIRNVARRAGKAATFMPKPLFGDNGSGMHTHLSLWKDDVPLFAGHGYAGLSELGLHAIGGILKHGPALCAFANPTTNSYKRLITGFEAPTRLSYSRRNRTRRDPHPGLHARPAQRSHRVSPARLRRQSLSAVLGDGHGGPRRDPVEGSSGRPTRQGHV